LGQKLERNARLRRYSTAGEMLAFLASAAAPPQYSTNALNLQVNEQDEEYQLCPERAGYPKPAKYRKLMTSAAGEDAYVEEHFFKNVDYGAYFDLGCGNGIVNSSTYYFNKAKKWTGICIEPNPTLHSQIFNTDPGYAGRIDGIRVAISAADGFENFSPKYGLQTDRGKVANNPSGLWFAEKYGGPTYGVSTITLTTIQNLYYDNKNYPYTKRTVHFTSLDTEGTEAEIMKTWNFAFNCVKAFAIANKFWCNKHSNLAALKEILHPQGYFHNTSLGNKEIFIRADSCPMIIDDRDINKGPLPGDDDSD
jgi:hypothetical protein